MIHTTVELKRLVRFNLTYKAMVIVFLLMKLFLYEIHYILNKMKIIFAL